MPEIAHDGFGAGTDGLTNGLTNGLTDGLMGQPGICSALAWRMTHHTVCRSIAHAAVRYVAHRFAYVSIVGGFTAASALCLIGLGCLVLPVPSTLQSSAGAFITLGVLWTVFAIVASNLWLGATRG